MCTNRKSDAPGELERGDGIGRRYEARALEDKADAQSIVVLREVFFWHEGVLCESHSPAVFGHGD